MKFLLISALLLGSVVTCLAQDIASKSEGSSESELTITIPGDQQLYLVSSMKTARIITKDEFEKIDHDQVDYIQVITDPSSTFIYGDKAKDGVVLIVMKENMFSEKFSSKRRRPK